jgi:DNA-binding FadR family transcriptional regulator
MDCFACACNYDGTFEETSSPMPFQLVESQRLYERVANQISELIGAGEFRPGQRLPAERDLARTLGVSRPVVREAMIALEVVGLVEVRTGSGAYVRERAYAPEASLNVGSSPSDILNARSLIEGEIAALAAEKGSASDIEAIAARVVEMEHEHDAGRPWHAADLGFHAAIAHATGNAALAGVVERLWQEQHGAMFSLLSERVRLSENWPATLAGHNAILAAIRGRRRGPARQAMRAHLGQVLDVMTGDGAG